MSTPTSSWPFCLVLAVAVLAAAVIVGAPEARAASTGRAPSWQKAWTPPVTASISPGPRLARSATGDLYVAALEYRSQADTYDWVLIRYTNSGVRKWVRRVSGAFNSGSLSGLATDAAGNVVAAGQITAAGQAADDWLVVKYSRAGKRLWTRRIAGSEPGGDRVFDIAAGPKGSFYVAGYLRRAGHYDDATLVRLSASGRRSWSRYLDGPGHSSDAFTAVAVDAKGRAYVTGYDYELGRANDVIVARYSASGHRDWLRHWGDDVALRHDRGTDIAVRGAVVGVAGSTLAGDVGWTERGLVLAYSTGGHLRWSRVRANDSPSLPASFTLAGVDGTGRVAVAGTWVTWAGQPAPLRWVTTVYGVTGGEGVVQRLWGDVEPYNFPQSLASSANGRVYEAGFVNYAATGRDALVVCLRPGGSVAWSSRVFSAGTGVDSGGDIVTTSKALYVVAMYGPSIRLMKYRL